MIVIRLIEIIKCSLKEKKKRGYIYIYYNYITIVEMHSNLTIKLCAFVEIIVVI